MYSKFDLSTLQVQQEEVSGLCHEALWNVNSYFIS